MFGRLDNEAINVYNGERITNTIRSEIIALKNPSQQRAQHEAVKSRILLQYIQLGTFITVIKEIIRIFGNDRLFLVDGDQVIKNPENEFGLLMNFFGIKSNLGFKYSDEKGFYCLDRPIPFCLGKSKGTTKREGNKTIDENLYSQFPAVSKWKESYKKSTFELFSHIFSCTSTTDCCSISVTRWTWLQSYFCTK